MRHSQSLPMIGFLKFCWRLNMRALENGLRCLVALCGVFLCRDLLKAEVEPRTLAKKVWWKQQFLPILVPRDRGFAWRWELRALGRRTHSDCFPALHASEGEKHEWQVDQLTLNPWQLEIDHVLDMLQHQNVSEKAPTGEDFYAA